MATTTPNFGWDIPQSTDLVKDGATAIAALGNDIDTSMVDLKGGTTGQVLSKASNTDMDFTWVAQDDSNAIQNTIVDAKGDIITATAADTPARLAVGSNGYTLVADSSAATGLAYGSSALANPIVNSAFDIAQRGTSISIAAAQSNVYTLDRWAITTYNNEACTVSRQATGDTTNLPNIQYCARVQRNSGQTGTTKFYFAQSLETTNSIPFVGKTITISFYARAGSNYSPTSSALELMLASGTGTDQNILSTYTGQATVINETATLTTTWQRFSYSGTVAISATELALYFAMTPTGTASTNDYYEITGVQIDLGSTALPFRRSGGAIQGELAAAQRYYQRFTTADAYSILGVGGSQSTTQAKIVCPLPVTMRTKPSAIDYSTLGLAEGGASIIALTALALEYHTNQQGALIATVASGLTANRPMYLFTNNSASAYLGFSAEL